MTPLEIAIQIAAKAHVGQTDKQGAPYITHPLAVMSRVVGVNAKIVAVLHDVIEDTTTTAEDLSAAGLDSSLVKAVQCVTHSADEPYADYVVRCKSNPLARQVKLADLEENCRMDRALLRPDQADRDFTRIYRYLLSYRFLTDALTEADYRALMAKFG